MKNPKTRKKEKKFNYIKIEIIFIQTKKKFISYKLKLLNKY